MLMIQTGYLYVVVVVVRSGDHGTREEDDERELKEDERNRSAADHRGEQISRDKRPNSD